MSSFLSWIYQTIMLHERPRSSMNFALFRILFFAHVLVMVYYTHIYKALLFDSVPGFGKNPFPFNSYLAIWFISASCCLVGFKTKMAAVVNYLCVVMAAQLYFRSGVSSYYDDLLRMGSLLSIFLPVARSFSIDARIHLINKGSIIPRQTSQFAYTFSIISTIGLMYLGSGLTKTYAPLWQSGLGLWLPLTMPYLKWNQLPNAFTEAFWLLKPLSYLIIGWEILFLPLIYFKPTRTIAIALGIVFHLSIGLFFFLPKTAIGTLFFYVFFIPDSFWMKVKKRVGSKQQNRVWVPENPLAKRCWYLLQAIDIRHKWLLTTQKNDAHVLLDKPESVIVLLKQYLLGYPIALFLQSGAQAGILDLLKWLGWARPFYQQNIQPQLSNYRTQLGIGVLLFFAATQLIVNANHFYSHIKGIQKPTGYGNEELIQSSKMVSPSSLARWLFGIDSRGVFLDKALVAKRKTIAITYTHLPTGQKGWLPLVQPNGYVQSDLNNMGEWTKPMLYYILKQNKIQPDGLKRVILFWAFKKKLVPYEFKFTILERIYDYPDGYKLGYCEQMEQIPWDTAGNASWEKDRFIYTPF